jgi:hypothetical protein
MLFNSIGLGLLDHLAQTLSINVNRPKRGHIKIRKRQFTKESTE